MPTTNMWVMWHRDLTQKAGDKVIATDLNYDVMKRLAAEGSMLGVPQELRRGPIMGSTFLARSRSHASGAGVARSRGSRLAAEFDSQWPSLPPEAWHPADKWHLHLSVFDPTIKWTYAEWSEDIGISGSRKCVKDK